MAPNPLQWANEDLSGDICLPYKSYTTDILSKGIYGIEEGMSLRHHLDVGAGPRVAMCMAIGEPVIINHYSGPVGCSLQVVE